MAKSKESEFEKRLAARLAKVGARVGLPSKQAPLRQRFRFRIRTKYGTTAGVSIYARDIYDAQYRLLKQYPGAEILGLNLK